MNIEKIRSDFPIAEKHVYLDSACMSLKPNQVIEAMNEYYAEFPACGERSSHRLGKKVTEEHENARKKIAKFIGAKPEEIIFTKNTTEGLNLASHSLGLKKENIVITSDKEHNSNFLPWLNFSHKIIPAKSSFFDLDSLEKAMSRQVKVVSVVHASNIDGMAFPIEKIAKIAHGNGSLVVVDGAQSVPHREINVKKLGCDMLAFSGHKMLGPSIGCLYIRKELAEQMQPFIVGGGTITGFEGSAPNYMRPPHKFEAGLQNYAGAIGLGAAVEYLESIGMKNIEKHEIALNKIITHGLEKIRNISVIGRTAEERGGIISFNIKGIASTEASLMFDAHNIMLRGGFHCCHNWFNTHRINGSVRASLYLYSNENDAERFVDAAKKVAALV